MKNSMYKNYADLISDSLKYGQKRGGASTKSYSLGQISGINLSDVQNNSKEVRAFMIDNNKDKMLFESLNALSVITGTKGNYHLKPGAHPDFQHIVNGAVESHYITSMFIDIKNSTNLFRKYMPVVVANITTAIQRAAIHTCWYFGGYIQRFHGDGLMVYFGGKNTPLSKSVENALNAASFFSYFIEHDLKDIFLEQGVEKIFTRIGIDAGVDEDVLWYQAGMGECSEISTCSLHTSLAAKMQSNATSNGIVVGDNVKDNISIDSSLFAIISEEKRYIFQIPEEQFNYTQWEFKWHKFLRNHRLVREDENGELVFVTSSNNNAHVVTPTTTTSSTTHVVTPATAASVDYLRKETQGYRPHYNG